jgi:hypothetical protein
MQSCKVLYSMELHRRRPRQARMCSSALASLTLGAVLVEPLIKTWVCCWFRRTAWVLN